VTAGGTGPVSREDLAVTLAVRGELGPGNEPAVIGEFLERVGPAIDARVDERLARSAPAPARRSGQPFLALASVVAGVPITAISLGAGDGGATGVVATGVAWAGLAAVNAAASWGGRGH
jgi:hypothetical protein